jgi:formylglycine-generating enzyme required for sulfatase activity
MGTVYEAIDESVSCVVALKERLATNDPDAHRAFEREAALLANLRHPLLPKVMHHFTDGDGQFLVMEFIQGYDLAELLELRGAPYTTAQVLAWADDLLKVLEYLHGRQPPILHRDIKPANLKLTKQGEIFVLDFGLAKGAAGQMPTILTSRSVHGYTPVYAPLEQIHGQGTDPRSDLYSLGATLYHLLTGTQPTDAPTRFTAEEDDQPDPLPPIDEVNPQVSQGIAAVIHQAMAISKRNRPASAAMMRKSLRKAEEQTDLGTELELENKLAEEAARMYAQAEAAHRSADAQRRKLDEPETRRLQEAESCARAVEGQTGRQGDEESRRLDEHTNAAGDVAYPALQLVDAGALNNSSAGLNQLNDERSKRRHRALIITVAAMVGVMLIIVVGWTLLLGSKAPADGSDQVSDGQKSTNQHAVVSSAPATATSEGKSFRNRSGIEMAWIPPGSFDMGSNDGRRNEKPVQRVTIGQGFFMSKHEVTQAQWKALMGNKSNRSYFTGDDNLPVDQISWNDAQNFIDKLNETNDGYIYSLPSEAEWEYACRAGTTGDFYAEDVNDIGWYYDNADAKTHRVGSKQANAFGIYDMSGNVWEWCRDWYVSTYEGAPIDGSARLSGSEQKWRVLRGGSWVDYAETVRSALRHYDIPGHRSSNYGFRLVAVERPQ